MEQVIWDGQLVGASCPLNVATIRPLELMKLAPDTCTTCPAVPLDGVREEITGAAPGAEGSVVVVVEGGLEGGEGWDVWVVPLPPGGPVTVVDARVAVDAGGAVTRGL